MQTSHTLLLGSLSDLKYLIGSQEQFLSMFHFWTKDLHLHVMVITHTTAAITALYSADTVPVSEMHQPVILLKCPVKLFP